MSHTDYTIVSEELDTLKKIREQGRIILKHTLDSKNWEVISQLKEFFDYFNSPIGFNFLLPNFMGGK